MNTETENATATANSAKQSASESAISSAQSAKEATAAKESAEKLESKFNNMDVVVETLPTGEPAEANVTDDGSKKTFIFKIPKGEKGEQGPPGPAGTGNVSSVNGVLPNESGDVSLSASDVNARSDDWIPDGLIYPIKTLELEAMSQEEQAALYQQGYRAIVATYNDTVTMHALAEDGSLSWIGCNQDTTNLPDNPDFGVAQAGYGGAHGVVTYAADRWEIYNAGAEFSIQGEANKIILSVTSGAISIFQRVQKLPDGNFTCGFYTPDGPSFVELKTTSPDFDLFEFTVGAGQTVTLNGAFLYSGSYTAKTLPPWVAPDPVVELAKCTFFFERQGNTYSNVIGQCVFCPSGAKSCIINIMYAKKRNLPTIVISDPSQYRVVYKNISDGNTNGAINIKSIEVVENTQPYASLKVTFSSPISDDSYVVLQRSDPATSAFIDVSSDL